MNDAYLATTTAYNIVKIISGILALIALIINSELFPWNDVIRRELGMGQKANALQQKVDAFDEESKTQTGRIATLERSENCQEIDITNLTTQVEALQTDLTGMTEETASLLVATFQLKGEIATEGAWRQTTVVNVWARCGAREQILQRRFERRAEAQVRASRTALRLEMQRALDRKSVV